MSRIRQQVSFDAAPATVFKAIADSADHAAFTGEAADIGAGAGDAWSAYGGKIHGVNVEVAAGQRIVQAWRSGGWEAGVFSLVTFEFAAEGDGTRLTLTHDAIPAGEGEHLDTGWENMYWAPLRTWLARG